MYAFWCIRFAFYLFQFTKLVKGGIDKKTMNKRLRKMSVLADIGNGDDYKEVEGLRR